MTYDEAVKVTRDYCRWLRRLKREGLTVEDMPEDVAVSALKVHQAALAAYEIIRQRRKQCKKKPKDELKYTAVR